MASETPPLAPEISVTFIDEEIQNTVKRLEDRKKRLGPFDLDAKLAVDIAISTLKRTSEELSESGMCRAFMIFRGK